MNNLTIGELMDILLLLGTIGGTVGASIYGLWRMIDLAMQPIKESLKEIIEITKTKADRETNLTLQSMHVREIVSFKTRSRPIMKALEFYFKSHGVIVEHNGVSQIGDLSYLVKLDDKEFINSIKQLYKKYD